MLQRIEGHPDLRRDSLTSQIVNLKDFKPFDQLFPFDRWDPKYIKPCAGDSWILKRWSILMHPWPEVISPGLTVTFEINGYPFFDVPLFEAARPLARSENFDLEKRIAALEEALKISPARPATEFLTDELLDRNREICVRVRGSADEFTLLRERLKVFSLRLEGFRRNAVRA